MEEGRVKRWSREDGGLARASSHTTLFCRPFIWGLSAQGHDPFPHHLRVCSLPLVAKIPGTESLSSRFPFPAAAPQLTLFWHSPSGSCSVLGGILRTLPLWDPALAWASPLSWVCLLILSTFILDFLRGHIARCASLMSVCPPPERAAWH